MEFKDYYEIMGVSRDATQDEIKRAYRKLARKYHPDVSKEPDAEQRFKEIGEAYEVLKDPEKRAAYDQLGANWQAGQDFRPPPDWDQGFEFHGGGFTGADAEQFSDFFESLFGRARGGRQYTYSTAGGGGFDLRGEDTYAKVLIDLEDAYQGATRTLTLKHTELGPDGRPQLRERTLNVRIPKGVKEGQHIRLARQGSPGIGKGEPGDLYLEVAFRPHPFYRVEGKDVYIELPVAPWEAALGAKVKVPTPAGAVDLKIPAGSKAGRKLRLKGRGIPAKQPGDFYVELQIALPPADDAEARTAYERFRDAFPGFAPRAYLGV
ncbi:DnaJ C-terminal domain-containing protein [endosymbiont of unidentified scaly snail isolate Monju]|uniref:DnaJ C-terminal domain-containing protein n=1 Tax=endosymbiont of unidentified scaly snail isolate Monju TaxID=1248727 RepID=UPI0003892351|nr:DnaJ C-terminal domain-containing protein [endosymbiont of unidentified scaly snail isolate Monju]BAN68300.1 curved DNA-binding protein [endosymbiont of unidentified scaly snail isolate Monju]